ncbi:PTS mannose/fructose/sorbose/N-acetylgalactosamine transporter subunit IIC [Serratia proteamaculans]|jgi:PTS system mannose-specific IIC component|uniref:PTS sugar transporter subunit IIC n=1 Tax=Serratia proteamaculans TaxID=28151 RepID=A0A1W5DRK1_SERPR|nr:MULTISPECIES: PTS sugar transporter subunit IIC [Serratia]HCV64445.1 PTS sugar transporter subunit IIC [Serratia sp. (in: enterobacteria)]KAB1495405.1 PTS sugar transporter subunit IIC [Serratia proteamaculans]MBI6182849.1 PTS sugar transporter subunit IIC [Serratia proteamaculans]MBO1502393.1 PTS sugar transporter subunit IIC [Serratia proteamaculans]MDW5511074.1 PTS sugar transporter subunit IIC [Serratia proteamaculans]
MWFEATLIGILCYLGALSSPWLLGLTGGWYILSRPLVSGMLVGAILGDVQTGIIIGVAVQAVYIAMVTPGGSMPADLNFVAFPAIALGILSGKGTEVAVALAATIGIMGTVLFNAMMVLNSYWNHRADLAVERGDERGIYLNSAIWPQVTNFLLRFIPTFIAVFFGARYINAFMDSLPALVLTTMNVVGGILPAVGIAILLKQIIKSYSMLIYFLVGFICIVFLKLNMVALVIVGALLALIHYNYKPEPQVAAAQAAPQADDEDEF